MMIAGGLAGAGVFLALPRVLPVFLANPWLNGFILCVFLIGVIACFWQVWQLAVSVRWDRTVCYGRYGSFEQTAAAAGALGLASAVARRADAAQCVLDTLDP